MKFPFLALAAGLIALVIWGCTDTKSPAELERAEAEYTKRIVDKHKADADTQIKANREARIKIFLKINPSWTRQQAESHIADEDRGAEAADKHLQKQLDSDKARQDVIRGCQILRSLTSSKRIGDLTVSEAEQIRACEAL